MGNRILELSTQVTGKKPLHLTGFAITNTRKEESLRISGEATASGLRKVTCLIFKMLEGKTGGVDIAIFKKFVALMRDFYENKQAPAALVLISDGDFITIIQWCKAVQLPCVLISDATSVNAALVAEMKRYKLGIYCTFQDLLPDVQKKKTDKKDKKDKKEKKNPIDINKSSQPCMTPGMLPQQQRSKPPLTNRQLHGQPFSPSTAPPGYPQFQYCQPTPNQVQPPGQPGAPPSTMPQQLAYTHVPYSQNPSQPAQLYAGRDRRLNVGPGYPPPC